MSIFTAKVSANSPQVGISAPGHYSRPISKLQQPKGSPINSRRRGSSGQENEAPSSSALRGNRSSFTIMQSLPSGQDLITTPASADFDAMSSVDSGNMGEGRTSFALSIDRRNSSGSFAIAPSNLGDDISGSKNSALLKLRPQSSTQALSRQQPWAESQSRPQSPSIMQPVTSFSHPRSFDQVGSFVLHSSSSNMRSLGTGSVNVSRGLDLISPSQLWNNETIVLILKVCTVSAMYG